jgi:hypothetical protein
MSEALITVDEAEEVVQLRTGPASALRAPLMAVLAILIVAVMTLLVMLIMSLSGSRTGLETLLPFLDTRKIERFDEPAV